jgi:hypothetical protein
VYSNRRVYGKILVLRAVLVTTVPLCFMNSSMIIRITTISSLLILKINMRGNPGTYVDVWPLFVCTPDRSKESLVEGIQLLVDRFLSSFTYNPN